jgi:hypothetical protein
MVSIIVWGVSGDKKCKKLLEKDNCVQQMVFCKYSQKGFRGSGMEVTTGFVGSNDTSLYFTTQAFVEPIPVGLPIVVRYSPECIDCSTFLWDSVIVHKGFRVKYYRIKHEGMNYKLTEAKK